MEKRAYRRIPVKLEGKFFSNDTSCIAYIRNVSALGVNAIITPMNCATDFLKEAKHELKIHISSGDTIKEMVIFNFTSRLNKRNWFRNY
jgi:hypothetical protein